jgi:subtilisin-like proprotein convertase family protein
VKVTIGHNYVTDIVIHLTHLEGAETTTLDLSSNNGSVGHNYLNTVFSDSGTSSVVTGTAPFTGVYRPEQPFARFFHAIVGGAWRMDVTDSYDDSNPSIDDGGFASFDLMLCVCTDCEVGPDCTDHTDNDHDGQIDCADTDCGTNLRCVPETACTDGIDNDLDSLTDCRDDQCNGHDHCEFAHETSCGDGIDNDADGALDCDDSDCSATPLCLIETNCQDHVDNDMDGKTDCDDPGCLAHGVGCQHPEVTCGDGVDNDADGQVDCADTDCQIGLSCGAVSACPAGQSTLVVASTGSPVHIPDSSTDGATLTIGIPQTGIVTRVIALAGITHTYDGDLTIDLIAPGVAAPGLSLASRVGGTGDGFTNTVFDDSAPTAITSGTPPYIGRFKPAAMLSTLIGRPLAGTWKLRAEDHAFTDDGSLDKFQLYICYTP